MTTSHLPLSKRFRGFLPVVVDVETGGFDRDKNPLLEIAAIIIRMDDEGKLYSSEPIDYHVEPFPGSQIDPESLKFNQIVPDHPFRFAVPEEKALVDIFSQIENALKETNCNRAVLVGHNAWFDLGFVKAAAARAHIHKHPFHSFTTFDTATLGGLVYGQTVLAKALYAAGIPFDPKEAHSALYDARQTAELFCQIVNQYPALVRK
ncbi:MAG: ribonuclease T [Proteobacteria bacterium]|nr:ribonuclease T [Pseudomonadota bacterium]